jgi:hypothetical protein
MAHERLLRKRRFRFQGSEFRDNVNILRKIKAFSCVIGCDTRSMRNCSQIVLAM